MPANFINTSGNIIANSGNFTTLIVNGSGVSMGGHTHSSSDITNFNSSVSGLLPTIANSGDNRVLTSTGSSVGINAESNLTFDGTLLNVSGSGTFASGVNISNQTGSTIASFDANKNVISLTTSTYPSLTELSYIKGVTSALQTQIDGKSSTSHTHGNITSAGAIGSTANLPLITTTAGAIAVGSFGSTASTFCEGNDSRLSDARTPLSHTHGNITNAGAIGSTANLPLITTTSGAITTGSFGSTANTFCQGNDSRLSDSRAPTGSAGGDLTGTYPNPTLTTTGVTGGTYRSVTVDTKGRITAGTNPTTLSGYGITDVGNGTLTLNVSGTGLSGSASFTANQSGNTTFTVTSNATSANTVSTIVARDASGNFSAGTITATLNGNASTATTASNVNNGTLTLNVSGTGLSGSQTFTANQSGNATFTVTSNATSANTASTIVARDASGNFSAGTITATLSGNASTATSATSATTATTATNWGTYGGVPAAGTSFANANTIGRSDINGYTYFGYINSSTGNSENPTVSQVIVTNGGDNFYRKASIAHLTSAVQSNASGSWSINVTGTAASETLGTVTGRGTTTNSIVQSNASVRAPIFYDSNDTNYYLDPNGTSVLNRVNPIGWDTSGRNYSREWIELPNFTGLLSGNNGAYFYPNNASYGAWRVAGTRNGWAGLEFDSTGAGQISLMMNSGHTGVHNNTHGWQWYWTGGVFYVSKGANGGGTIATVLDTSNYAANAPVSVRTFRAWGVYDGSATSANPGDGVNMGTMTRSGTATYTCNFGITLPNTNYGVLVSGQVGSMVTQTRNTGSVVIVAQNLNGVQTQAPYFTVAILDTP